MKQQEFTKVLQGLDEQLTALRPEGPGLEFSEVENVDLDAGQKEIIQRIKNVQWVKSTLYDHDCQSCRESLESDVTQAKKYIRTYLDGGLSDPIHCITLPYMKSDGSESFSIMAACTDGKVRVLSFRDERSQTIIDEIEGKKCEDIQLFVFPKTVGEYALVDTPAASNPRQGSVLFKQELPSKE